MRLPWKRSGLVLLLALLVLAAGAFWYLRGRNSPPIAAAGGSAFTNFTALATPHYLQRDPQWKDETIGSGETLAKVGCTVASLAMALEHFGVHFTPKTLNEALKTNGGYTRRGWILWSAVAKVSEGKASIRLLDKPTHADIDAALQGGHPVLAKVFINKVIPHWVLVSGKDGTNYLMRDPLNEAKSLEPLAKYGSDIYGVRIVEPGLETPNPKLQTPGKHQALNINGASDARESFLLGAWCLGFIWCLMFGAWGFIRRPAVAHRGLAALVLLLACAPPSSAQPATRWWKGNLHTHTLWSDGDDFPEMVVDWYKTRGYDFLALSDHNTLQAGAVGVVETNQAIVKILPKYIRRFGTNAVTRGVSTNGTPLVLLKTLPELRTMFEAPGRFLLIQAEEVTAHYGNWPIHLIASNIRDFVRPRRGESPVEVMQNNIDAVLAQRERTGIPMMVHIAHPNFRWAITAEDMIQLRGERFFEVYNGHPLVFNEGNADHASTDRMWDIVNTHRIAERRDLPLLGLAVDDAHHYSKFSPSNANTGRGWVMVRAAQLKADAIINALEAGDFYSSSGVELSEVVWKANRLTVRIVAEPGVTYTTQFIGTKRPVDWRHKPVVRTNGQELAVTRLYSGGMGAVWSEQTGTNVSYTCQGDELYVRAKIVSSKLMANGVVPGERECAWTQPVLPVK